MIVKKDLNIEAIFYLTKHCNYNCTYCFKGNQHETGLIISVPRIKQFFKDISSKQRINEFYLRIRGGEFSLEKDSLILIEELLKQLVILSKNTKITFKISTNLGGDISFFKDLNKLFLVYKNKINFAFDISIHNAYFKQFFKSVDKIKYLNINDTQTTRIVFDNFDFDIISKDGLIKLVDEKVSDIIEVNYSYKFLNKITSLYLDKRDYLDTQILIDENILPLINGKYIQVKKFLKYV